MRSQPTRSNALSTRLHPPLLLLAIVLATACAPGDSKAPEADLGSTLAGSWRAVLHSPGGELPFGLEVASSPDGFSAVALNGEERAPFDRVEIDGNSVVFSFDVYDASVTASYDPATETLSGEWRKTIPGGTSQLLFTATRGYDERFASSESGSETSLEDVTGVWEVEFTDEDGSEPARGEFTQTGTEVRGTFLTPTGDYRYLDGTYADGLLRLSTFDGAHAFLFSAQADADGDLTGDFWSRDVYHATWTARRVDEAETAAVDWQSVGLASDDGKFRFAFPDLEGNTVTLDDERFAAQVVVVNIFGSWCPNCNDEAPLLAEWDRRWRDQGLAIVGLAYEFTGDFERDAEQVRRYAARHEIDFPLLVAGTSDKKDAAATLPDLTEVIAYPTTVFIDRTGQVRRIHSGFAGPGTGRHYEELRSSLEETVAELLDEA